MFGMFSVIDLMQYRSSNSSIYPQLIFNLALSAVMTPFAKKAAKRNLEKLGLSNNDQMWTVTRSIKNNTIPGDRQLSSAMATLLDKRINFSEKSIRYAPLFILLFVVILIASVIERQYLSSTLFGFIVLIIVYAFYSSKNKLNQMKDLRRHLASFNVVPQVLPESNAEADDWNLDEPISATRQFSAVGIAVLLFLMVLLFK
jgi:Ca2+/Na+ antiporter